MKYLSSSTQEKWFQTAKVLEQDGHGVKVMALADGTYIKLFRVKRLLSSKYLFPQASRFAKNAKRLHELSIPCPVVIATWKLKNPARNLVHYQPLPGETLRDIRKQNPQKWHDQVLPRVANFVRKLHEMGVYFRSLHLGNIILTPDSKLGLIDIADLRFYSHPLPKRLRKRNIKHLTRYEEDWSESELQQLLPMLG